LEDKSCGISFFHHFPTKIMKQKKTKVFLVPLNNQQSACSYLAVIFHQGITSPSLVHVSGATATESAALI
jgi:hypothetical protein